MSRSSRWTIPGRSGRRRRRPRPSEPVHERPGRVPGARVDDEPGRLVDDEQVLVLVGDPERRASSGSSSAPRRSASARTRAPRRPRAGGSSAAPRRRRARAAARAAARPRRASRPREATARKRSSRSPAASGRDDEPCVGADAPARRGGRRATSSAPSRMRDADDDEAVGEVEGGPVAQVEEVGHVPEPDPVDEVRVAAADQEPERDRQHGMARAGAREEDEHPADRERGQHDHDRRRAREEAERDPGVLDVVDRERADDVRATRRARAGSRRSCFVSWSATIAASDDGAEPDPLHGAGRERARARPRPASSPSVLEPTRTSSVRDAGSVTRAPPCACSRCTASPTGRASSRSSAIGLPAASRRCRTSRRRSAASAASISASTCSEFSSSV